MQWCWLSKLILLGLHVQDNTINLNRCYFGADNLKAGTVANYPLFGDIFAVSIICFDLFTTLYIVLLFYYLFIILVITYMVTPINVEKSH